MRRVAVIGLVIVGIAAGTGVAALLIDGDDERLIAPISVPATSGSANTPDQRFEPPRVYVDDGIPVDEAEAVARAAVERVPGAAFSVDFDDGRYEVEVQRPDGAIVEVLLDGRSVVGVDQGEGDG